MQQLEAFIPGTISPGIESICFFRSRCFTAPFVANSTHVATNITAYSTGIGAWALDVLVSNDDGANYAIAQSFVVPAGTAFVGDFAGLVVPKCGLIKLKYRKGFGTVSNPMVNIILDRLN